MTPKWIQNGSLEASGRPLGPKWLEKWLPARSWDAPGTLLGRSWVAPGRSWAAPGVSRASPGGSRRGCGRSFWERCRGKAWWHGKSKKHCDFLHVWKLLSDDYCVFFFALPAAPAQARTLENRFSHGGCSTFRMSAVFAQKEKLKMCMQKHVQQATEKHFQNNLNTHKKSSTFGPK